MSINLGDFSCAHALLVGLLVSLAVGLLLITWSMRLNAISLINRAVPLLTMRKRQAKSGNFGNFGCFEAMN